MPYEKRLRFMALDALPNSVAFPAKASLLVKQGVFLPRVAFSTMGSGKLVSHSNLNCLPVPAHKNISGLCYALFKTHSLVSSANNRIWLEPAFPSQVRKSVLNAVESNKSLVGFIGLLLQMGSPPAIRRLVVSFIINSIQRCSIRPLSHVFKECFKIVPSLANPYTPSSVSMVSGRFGVAAPLAHGKPCRVDRVLCVAHKKYLRFYRTAYNGLEIKSMEYSNGV